MDNRRSAAGMHFSTHAIGATLRELPNAVPRTTWTRICKTPIAGRGLRFCYYNGFLRSSEMEPHSELDLPLAEEERVIQTSASG